MIAGAVGELRCSNFQKRNIACVATICYINNTYRGIVLMMNCLEVFLGRRTEANRRRNPGKELAGILRNCPIPCRRLFRQRIRRYMKLKTAVQWAWFSGLAVSVCLARGDPLEDARQLAAAGRHVFGGEDVAYAAGRAELLIFSSWLSAYAQHHQGASAGNLEDAMRMRARTVLETGADGLCLHEAHTFEHYKGFDTVAEMRHTFDAGSINA